MAEQGALGPILRAARERAHLTQAQLAARVGLASNHIARLESGEKGIPRFDTVARLAAELGLSLDELSWSCGYTEQAKVRTKDRTAIAQAANDLAKVLEAVQSLGATFAKVEKSLSGAVTSLQRQAGIPKESPESPRRKKQKRRS